MSDFEMMGLPSMLTRRLDELGLTTPTPIQKQAIPHGLNGRDVMGLAQTGTGKTAAFGVPLIAQMLEMKARPAPKSARGLVLAPTRELVNQITQNLRGLAENSRVRVTMVVGGQAIGPQVRRLERGTDLLIATPGRLLDLLDRGAILLDETVFLVLDEADQMLDMGFIHDLRKIASILPETRQTMLFSATMPKQINELAQTYLNRPVRVEVSAPGKPADKVTQEVHFIAKSEKPALLIEMLDAHRHERALVFCRTKHGAERLMKQLNTAGFAAASIHGNKSQGQRDRALAAFTAGDTRVLVATDVAARGLDIPDVKHVYNFDLPNVPDNYVHRIGRTARAGKDGAAISFCAPDEMDALRDIEKTMHASIPVGSGRPWEPEKPVAKTPARRRKRPGQGRKGPPSGPSQSPPKRRRRRPGSKRTGKP
ncbi:MAG: DEAD/DEAH box helicase [Pseudomonadota bacterium]